MYTGPVAVDDTFTQKVGAPTQVYAPGMLKNDDVPCGDQATIKVVTPPQHGSITAIADDGSFTYTPGSPQESEQIVYEVNCLGKVRWQSFK